MGELIKKGNWVKVSILFLEPNERSSDIPDETKQFSYSFFVSGFLIEDAEVGNTTRIKTMADRVLEGTLIGKRLPFKHSFGRPVDALLRIGPHVRNLLKD